MNPSHHWSCSNNLWVWQAGKRKAIWCFKPVVGMGGQKVGQKEGHQTCAALFVHTKTPLYAYTHSSLQLRPANLLSTNSHFTDICKPGGLCWHSRMPTECPIWKINSVSHLSWASLMLIFTDGWSHGGNPNLKYQCNLSALCCATGTLGTLWWSTINHVDLALYGPFNDFHSIAISLQS